jgi:hypothetical protein
MDASKSRDACQQCCRSGSGIQCLCDPWIWDPGSGIGFSGSRILDLGSRILDLVSRILDPGSRIPNPYFLELSGKFLGKKICNSLKIGPNFLLQYFKNKTINNFVKFVAKKKGTTTNFFHPSLLLQFLDPGSGIRDE